MRETRKKIAEQTILELHQGYYINRQGNTIELADTVRKSVANTIFYKTDTLAALVKNATSQASRETYNVSVTKESTIACLIRIAETNANRIGLLNFASAKNPGGGFLGGSQAQEESLARSSTLYASLTAHDEFYKTNKNARPAFYADNLLYSPGVAFFKDDAGNYLDAVIQADVITMPAVNKSAITSIDESIEKEIDKVMKQRIRYVLAVAEKNQMDTLILGAWGCGVFRNKPADVANYFSQVLQESPSYRIPKLIFAIIGSDEQALTAFLPLAK
ncbi:TIGR02452 family protein [Chryseolinea soli]|uniref:TIGR02452 family protein n=1 Tax=Chryseolinea soli TaxID=2321403 RepID=A0A385SKR8_9BACT|nr:TIGR02452 family protein [Chryseolinea soli]AYB30000.1 TIGR02452 family protein [Chryseolinea soli]